MTTETKKFDAEVGKILHLMIHSLYTNKEIFIRELISNSSDACDKLRYLSQTEPSLLSDDIDLKVSIKIDKEQKTITIIDNGIGMSREDLADHLGTIAKSGTQGFLQQLSGDSKKDSMLIGQFGVGFYSGFMVADKISVVSKKAGQNQSYMWESSGTGEYTISDVSDEHSRGTKVTLHIKPEDTDFLDQFKLKHIVKSYSDHIAIPIYFTDDSGSETKLNSSSALWTRPKSEITNEQYLEMYKSVAHSIDEPWLILHNKNEGAVEFTNLLFIPSQKTFDQFHPDRKRRVKLYIRRVYISDENMDLIPQYLRFLRGVVDSEDLPLNISRETLQHNRTLAKINAAITKKVISEINKKKNESIDDYTVFWSNFGSVLKEGLCEATSDHEKLLEICIFESALHNKMISLDEYIANCKNEQKTIYYLSGDDAQKLRTSPQIEGFVKEGIDVLLFTDTVDDFWVNVNNKYKDYEIKSVTRSDIDLKNENNDEQNEINNQDYQSNEQYIKLTEYFKNVLGDLVKEVKISKKLTQSPACLAVDSGAMDMRMERFLIEQKQLQKSSAKILELNPKHKIIEKIHQNITDNINIEDTEQFARLIFDQACIIEGEVVEDTAGFSERLNTILQKVIS
ncbi:MAG: molecular chaperone HtpG [Rickettsiaceae bacterium]|nr:MAG: molecular chaperone HtpG [Rickettsiaceae bacterium]